MWTFRDKGNRECCLIPEVTGLIQEIWRNDWSKKNKTRKVFYINRCYRYERPQLGRYREFSQFGIEYLGEKKTKEEREEVLNLLRKCLSFFPNLEYNVNDTVKRGLSYYIEDGFEVEAPSLGAQKQIAGGGRYEEGIGWAIGIDRLLLSI